MLYLARELGLPAGVVGVLLAVSSGAAVLAAFLASPISQRLGHGPTFIVGTLLASLAGFVLAAADGPFPFLIAILVIAQILRGAGPPLYSVNQSTVRMTLAPPDMLARVNATWRFLVFGAQPVGALLAGAIAGAVGLRTTLVISGFGMLLGVVVAAFSPLRGLRTLPA